MNHILSSGGSSSYLLLLLLQLHIITTKESGLIWEIWGWGGFGPGPNPGLVTDRSHPVLSNSSRLWPLSHRPEIIYHRPAQSTVSQYGGLSELYTCGPDLSQNRNGLDPEESAKISMIPYLSAVMAQPHI